MTKPKPMWPFEPDHQHVMVEVERWSTSTGEYQIRQRCSLCPKVETATVDRDDE